MCNKETTVLISSIVKNLNEKEILDNKQFWKAVVIYVRVSRQFYFLNKKISHARKAQKRI